MNKNNFSFFIILFVLFINSKSFGQAAILSALERVKATPYGNVVSTYEDVGDIPFEPNFDGATLSSFKDSDLPSWVETYQQARSALNIDPGTLYNCEGSGFISSHFFMDSGQMDASGNWNHGTVLSNNSIEGYNFTPLGFPYSDPSTNGGQKPGSTPQFHFCLSGTFDYIRESPVALASSIYGGPRVRYCRRCGINPDCEHTPIILVYPKGTVSLGAYVENCSGLSSGRYAQIIYKDRTPPWIIDWDQMNKRFPTLGDSDEESKRFYTGDYHKMDELEITDNSANMVGVRVLLGKRDACPRGFDNWQDKEEWDDTSSEPQLVELTGDPDLKGKLDDIVIQPNICYGYMRYSVFAQEANVSSDEALTEDKLENLNPGCATIEEDKPEICYGLPDTDERYEDLGDNPGSAKPWPYRPDSPNTISINAIRGDQRVKGQEGFIRIFDNDLPNIMIRLTSKKNEDQLFFPPNTLIGNSSSGDENDDNDIVTGLLDSSDSIDGYANNVQAYNDFCNGNTNGLCVHNLMARDPVLIQEKDLSPYFTIFSLTPSKYANDEDKRNMSRFIGNSDKVFIAKHFRLEDQLYSDTDEKGDPDTSINNIGKRNGTWEECVALIGVGSPAIIIQEDVEYDLDVWVDDSVKWANARTGFGLREPDPRTISIPTGVVSGKVTIDIPNQYPAVVKKEYPLNNYGDSGLRTNFNKVCKVVFREPTITGVPIASIQDLEKNKFPSIEVEATDYAGNTRKIKLFIVVTNEKAYIRTLQRKHTQHD